MAPVTAMPARHMSKAEWQTRVDLAACYRLVDLSGWSDLVNTRRRRPTHFVEWNLTAFIQ
jgi:hypothetical protein